MTFSKYPLFYLTNIFHLIFLLKILIILLNLNFVILVSTFFLFLFQITLIDKFIKICWKFLKNMVK